MLNNSVSIFFSINAPVNKDGRPSGTKNPSRARGCPFNGVSSRESQIAKKSATKRDERRASERLSFSTVFRRANPRWRSEKPSERAKKEA